MTNWIKLIEDNEDRINEAFREAIKDATRAYTNYAMHGGYYVVQINNEGKIDSYYQESNVISGDVKNDTARYIGHFPVATDWEFGDEEDFLEEFMDDGDYKKFLKANWTSRIWKRDIGTHLSTL